MILRTLLFLIINFGGLFIGGLFTGEGVPSDWYQNLNKAPWTPPGWVFGAAWTTIMICFSVYMAILWKKITLKNLLYLYIAEFILNVIWNPLFFHFKWINVALLSISLLTILIIYMAVSLRVEMRYKTLLIFPYLIWLIIATSLNGYIVLYN
ncbi:MAG: TspO/MBR family protein [Bacteroidota bacterium]|nr:TspO/MBR family protein [Bacteroidota bacterium]|tara:strand:+ start:558 stop:1013 length:456 start_codon:yes stop_codon:yes gene_type:complete